MTELAIPVDLDRDHWRGGPDARVTLLEYGDYECPYSRAAFRRIEILEREWGDRLRFVYRQLPLSEIHPHALAAAGWGEAAGRHGRFWEMHAVLFHNQRELEDADLARHAAAAGCDPDELARDLAGDEVWARVREDADGAWASGAQGTPTLFIDGVLHTQGYDVEVLRAALEAAAAR